MALKFRITKAKYDALGDDFKSEYKADGDKHFVLDVDGLEDTDALKRAKDRAEQETVDLRAELKIQEKEVATLKAAAGDGGADVARLTRAHERKLASMTEEHTTTLAARDTFIRETLVDGEALKLATAISTVPSLMADNVKKRLDVDFTGDKPKLVIKDKAGNPDPAMTIDKLKTEILANPEYKPILTGSKATGSATPKGNLPAAGATHATNPAEAADINALSGKDFVARLKAKRGEAGTGADTA